MNSMLKLTLVPLAITTFLVACSSRPEDYNGGGGSRVANFTITNFEAPSNGKAWDKIQVTMSPIKEGKAVDKSFDKAAFAAGEASDVALKVEYGTYKINLLYTDKDGKSVYESCEEEKAVEHLINQPKFSTKIKVCAADKGSKPGTDDTTSGEDTDGTTSIVPSADVTVTPELQE